MSDPLTPTERRTDRPWRRIALALIALLAVAVGLWLADRGVFKRSAPPTPPAVIGERVDPGVVSAVTLFRDRVLAAPRSAEAWGKLGMVFMANSFFAEACDCFAEAARLDPAEPRWPYLRGYTLLARADSQIDNPLTDLRRADSLGGDAHPAVRLKLAEELLVRGEVEESDRLFRQVLDRAPTDARARLGLARVAHRRGDEAACREHLQVAVADPLTRKPALLLLAEVDLRQGRRAAAEQGMQTARELPPPPLAPDPFYDEVESLKAGRDGLMSRAGTLRRQDRLADAVELLTQATRDYPDAPEPWLQLGRVELQRGNLSAAAAALANAVRLDDGLVEGHVNLGIALYQLGRQSDALTHFRRATQLMPSHGQAWYNQGQCLRQAGQRE
ncbi:MAG: tetratricopeptide repeat protein, partial [Gemmataceae bacterium]